MKLLAAKIALGPVLIAQGRRVRRDALRLPEAAGARSFVWYSGVSGLLAGASPWIARAARGLERAQSVTEAEGRLALLFFLTGALTGAIYWLIAAPGSDSPRPSLRDGRERARD